jgi:hypothetical protein
MEFLALDDKAKWAFEMVLRQLKEAPGLLDMPECPYSNEMKQFIRKLAGAGNGKTVETADLEEEARQLYDELTEFGQELTTDDVSERMAWFRTRTNLLEKILSIKERTRTLKQMGEFEERVIGILEDVMTADQRTEVMARLKD